MDTQHTPRHSAPQARRAPTGAASAAKRGERRYARALLRQVLASEPRNETAWLLLAHVAQTRQQARQCLRQVLAINPHNVTARRKLAAWQRANRRKPPSRSTRRKALLWKIGSSSLLALELTVSILLFAGYLWYAPQLPPLLPSISVCRLPTGDSYSASSFAAAPPHTPTAVSTPTPTTTPTAIPPRTPPPTTLPKAHTTGIRGHPQSLSLDCEARSAVDWAAYFGVEIDELEFFHRLPRSDNPDTGFVGNARGRWGQIPPHPYGVHAEPVAALLKTYGLDAQAVRGFSLDGLRAEISSGRPVIVWVVGHVNSGSPVYYTAPDGHRTVVASFEHTVIVTGYDDYGVTVLDGAQVYARRWIDFERSWIVLGNMGIVKRR